MKVVIFLEFYSKKYKVRCALYIADPIQKFLLNFKRALR